jgi:hypothetical protein
VGELAAEVARELALDLPADCGPWIAAMLGGGERKPGHPHEHVHQFPEEPEDGPPPEYVPFTVERMPRMRSQFGTCVSPTRVIPLTAERGDCRHCKREVVHGAGGWRLDDGTPSPQACASAPLGFHEA